MQKLGIGLRLVLCVWRMKNEKSRIDAVFPFCCEPFVPSFSFRRNISWKNLTTNKSQNRISYISCHREISTIKKHRMLWDVAI